MSKVYIGTSGFYYNHWAAVFYPENLKKKDWFSYYVKHFNTIEINSSFYRIPLKKTVESWKEKVPENFIFVFKISRFITHIKKLNPDKKSLKIFFSVLSPFAQKPPKHLILIQTPRNLKKDLERLKNLCKDLPKTFLFAFEFRNKSWFDDEVYEILKKSNCSLVLADSPHEKWPKVDRDTADFGYIRFHGGSMLYSSNYKDEELKEYAKLIKDKLKKRVNIYCYFNNDAKGYAVKNAVKLKELVS